MKNMIEEQAINPQEELNITTIENTPVSSWKINTKNTYKYQYSEVCTPISIARKMIDHVPQKILSTFSFKCLDAGCGSGNLTFVLYKYIFQYLCVNKKRDYILNEVFHVLDINKQRLEEVVSVLPLKNVFNINFLEFECNVKYDLVVSNPPFIVENKRTIWPDFFRKCVDVLNPNGYLCIICPSIWMKPIHPMYAYITQFRIHSITNIQNNTANAEFGGDARTPMSYMLLEKTANLTNTIPIYDKFLQKYIPIPVVKMNPLPIPMYYPNFISKMLQQVHNYGSLKLEIQKTNCPSKLLSYAKNADDTHTYPNIKTCKMQKGFPAIIMEYGDKQSMFSNKRKVVMANKMYGIPYYDKMGEFGISSRDNYVYVNDDDNKCQTVLRYLNLDFILLIYETTRYRMGYLEKYAFEFIPNILNMNIDVDDISDESISKLFGFTDEDKKCIHQYVSKLRIKRFIYN